MKPVIDYLLKPIVFPLVVIGLAGCSTTLGLTSQAAPKCPPMVTYSAAEQQQMADQLSKLPGNSQLSRLTVDYGNMRNWVKENCPQPAKQP